MMKKVGSEQYRDCHIHIEHRSQFRAAHNWLRLWYLHHDDAAILHANVWRGNNLVGHSGHYDLGSHRLAAQKICYLAAYVADTADFHDSLDYGHLCAYTH